MLSNLDLFDTPASSALTFLRIFTARSFMLDVDRMYDDRKVRKTNLLDWFWAAILYFHYLHVVPCLVGVKQGITCRLSR